MFQDGSVEAVSSSSQCTLRLSWAFHHSHTSCKVFHTTKPQLDFWQVKAPERPYETRKPIKYLRAPANNPETSACQCFSPTASFSTISSLLTFFSKFFSSFLRSTCSLSVSHKYLALEEVYLPFRAAVPSNPTLRNHAYSRHFAEYGSITLFAISFQRILRLSCLLPDTLDYNSDLKFFGKKILDIASTNNKLLINMSSPHSSSEREQEQAPTTFPTTAKFMASDVTLPKSTSSGSETLDPMLKNNNSNNNNTTTPKGTQSLRLPNKTNSFVQEFEPIVDTSKGNEEVGGFKRDMKFVMHNRSASPTNSIGKQLSAHPNSQSFKVEK